MTEGYAPFTQCTKQAKTNDRAFKQIQMHVSAKSPQLCLTFCDPMDCILKSILLLLLLSRFSCV